MAQLSTRGTLTRSRWDYFEHSNGWASVYGSATSGLLGAYLANNSTGTMQLDIYHLEWYASVTSNWSVGILAPPLILTPLAPGGAEVHPCQPDKAALAGVVGMYTADAGAAFNLVRYSNQTNSGSLAPISGEPFVTLPPGWAIAVNTTISSNPCELSITVWYQEIIDNVSPAR